MPPVPRCPEPPGGGADLILGAVLAHYSHAGQPDRAWIDDVIDAFGQAGAPLIVVPI